MREVESRGTLDRRWWLPWVVIAAAGVLTYANSFQGQFVFDDVKLTDDYSIRGLWPPWRSMFSESHTPRPFVGLSLAMNYAVSGLDLWSYHAFNLVVHILAAATLYGLVRRTLLTKALRDRYGGHSGTLALIVALIWLVHPLHTQSVTYIIQRSEAMAGLFYLLTLYCVITGVESERPTRWYAASVAACAAGMGSKPVMVTAPILVFLYCAIFLTGSVREEVSRRWRLYAGLASTWIILAATLYFSRGTHESAGFGLHGLTAWSYLKSQFGVITHYLRLTVWPSSLCLDYGWPIAQTSGEVLPYAGLVAGLALATLVALLRRAPIGFLGAGFFLVLAPTSSIMPIADLAVEHRMYLPLAAVSALVIIGSYRLASDFAARAKVTGQARSILRLACVGLAIVAAGWLGSLTVRRNADYYNRVLIWQDVVDKRPENARGHNNLGLYLLEVGRLEEAFHHLNEALRLNPNFADAHNNLGMALANTGRMDEAVPFFYTALRIRPNLRTANYNLGQAFASKGKFEQALIHYREEIRINPYYPEAHLQLGFALESLGRLAEAAAEYRAALELKRDWPQALCNLSLVLIRKRDQAGDPHDALVLAQRAVDLTGRREAIPLDILGVAYATNGRFEEAVGAADLAMRLAFEAGDTGLSAAIQARLRIYKQALAK